MTADATPAAPPDPRDPHEPHDPHAWARSWLPADDEPYRPLATLATVDLDGAPAGRSVLLSSVTETGFTFHTDARSAKVAQIGADPRVGLIMALAERTRQLVVQGTAWRQGEEASLAAWRRRSPYLRQLAWLNDDSFAVLPEEQRRERWAAAVAANPDGPTDPPGHWVGYDVVPHRYVFWEGGTDVLASHRTEFRLTEGRWVERQLAG